MGDYKHKIAGVMYFATQKVCRPRRGGHYRHYQLLLIKSQTPNMRRYFSFSSNGLKSFINGSSHYYHFILGKYFTISIN